jgi:signal peptidase I
MKKVTEKIRKSINKKNIISLAKCIGIPIIIILILQSTVVANAQVMSGSMESTIMTGSRVIASRVAYVFDEPQRFDIILFMPPDNIIINSPPPYIKRIIGLPNETVEIINGKVHINGSDVPLDDTFIKEAARGNFGPFIIPEDSYFVLGDNRNNSYDSKNWGENFVTVDLIMGKIIFKYYPSPQMLN